MRILNLYAGLGGNRTEWGYRHQVTAVEWDPATAAVYQERFPDDTVVIGDAHAYLIEHLGEFDFIWSSPPCQSHGQYRYNVGVRAKGYAPVYPDLTLYEEILLLQHHTDAPWVVENVQPYYVPIVPATARIGRHMLWSNMDIPPMELPPQHIRTMNKIEDFDHLGVDIRQSAIRDKRQALRNMVDARLGLHILLNAERYVVQ
jgi:DNA (cytosine-5)-methyltransferase 1